MFICSQESKERSGLSCRGICELFKRPVTECLQDSLQRSGSCRIFLL